MQMPVVLLAAGHAEDINDIHAGLRQRYVGDGAPVLGDLWIARTAGIGLLATGLTEAQQVAADSPGHQIAVCAALVPLINDHEVMRYARHRERPQNRVRVANVRQHLQPLPEEHQVQSVAVRMSVAAGEVQAGLHPAVALAQAHNRLPQRPHQVRAERLIPRLGHNAPEAGTRPRIVYRQVLPIRHAHATQRINRLLQHRYISGCIQIVNARIVYRVHVAFGVRIPLQRPFYATAQATDRLGMIRRRTLAPDAVGVELPAEDQLHPPQRIMYILRLAYDAPDDRQPPDQTRVHIPQVDREGARVVGRHPEEVLYLLAHILANFRRQLVEFLAACHQVIGIGQMGWHFGIEPVVATVAPHRRAVRIRRLAQWRAPVVTLHVLLQAGHRLQPILRHRQHLDVVNLRSHGAPTLDAVGTVVRIDLGEAIQDPRRLPRIDFLLRPGVQAGDLSDYALHVALLLVLDQHLHVVLVAARALAVAVGMHLARRIRDRSGPVQGILVAGEDVPAVLAGNMVGIVR